MHGKHKALIMCDEIADDWLLARTTVIIGAYLLYYLIIGEITHTH